MERIAVAGPPGSGKSTLIRTISGGSDGPKRGHTVYSMDDKDLVRLAAAERSEKITPVRLSLEEVDAASISALHDYDCIVIVVGALSESDAGRAVEIAYHQTRDFLAEIVLEDLEVVEKAAGKLEKVAAVGDRRATATVEAAMRLIEALQDQDLASAAEIASDTSTIPKDWGLLCTRPRVAVVNVDDDSAEDAHTIEVAVRERLGDSVSGVLASPLDIEAELAELDPEDASEMAASYSIAEPIGRRLSKAILDALDLVVFYTANEREARAWTLRRGSTALEAAGRIHSDMERGFIRAEAISVEELLLLGSLKDARRAGAVRTEGKGYEVKPGDVLWIRFNV